ncbi:hypothetical protein BAC3_01424 [uncultured bacterium]|nr:hypothetical protein BAC3_01424 [uncultured bacterium]
MKTNLVALIAGVLFGLGLSLSHMVNPNKVLDFLDITGHFDPSLMFVMVGALSIAFFGFRWAKKLPAPFWADRFQLSKKTVLDKPLIIGAAIFGIGWGMTGYCPGPALTGLGLFSLENIVVVLAMCAGFASYHWLFERDKS